MFFKEKDFFCEDVENERLYFLNFKTIFDHNEGIASVSSLIL